MLSGSTVQKPPPTGFATDIISACIPSDASASHPSAYCPCPFSVAALAPVVTSGVLRVLAEAPVDDWVLLCFLMRCFFIGADAPSAVSALCIGPAVGMEAALDELPADVCANAPVAKKPIVNTMRSVFLVIAKSQERVKKT
jgi:hypothetical protein